VRDLGNPNFFELGAALTDEARVTDAYAWDEEKKKVTKGLRKRKISNKSSGTWLPQ
jgi:hypothetical protein